MAEEVAALQYRLEASTARFERQIKRAESVMKRSAGQMERGARQSSRAFDATARAAGRMVAAILTIEGVRRAISELARSGEQLRTLEARFDALTGSAERAGGLLSGVLNVSGSTGGGIDAVGQLVSQFRIAADGIGASDAEVVRFTESLIKLGTIGGSTITEISNGTRQLSQGLAGGVLRAEEFNSVVENTPLIAKALADELAGGSLGALRAMVLEGRVLSDQVFSAILRQSADIDANFEKLPVTMERATNRLATSMTVFLAGLDEALGVSEGIASALERAASFLDRIPDMFGGDLRLRGITDDEILAAGGANEAIAARAGQTTPSTEPVVSPAGPSETDGGASSRKRADPFDSAVQGSRERLERMAEELHLIGQTEEAIAMLRREYEVARLERDLLTAAEADGRVTEQELEAIREQARQYRELSEGIEIATRAQKEMEEAQKRAADAMGDQKRAVEGIGNAFTAGISPADSFKDALKGVALQLLNLGVQGLFGAGPLGPALGNVLGNVKIPGFASGTNSAPGGLAMVGERGPELVNLPRGSQVFSNRDSRRLMGGGGITLTMTVDARGSQIGAAEQIEARLRRFAQVELLPAMTEAQRRA